MDEEQIRYMNALLQEINDAIITFDRDMIIQSWNKGAERIYGWLSLIHISEPTRPY